MRTTALSPPIEQMRLIIKTNFKLLSSKLLDARYQVLLILKTMILLTQTLRGEANIPKGETTL